MNRSARNSLFQEQGKKAGGGTEMILNAVLDYLWIRMLCIYGEFRYRRVRKCAPCLKFFMMMVPICGDMWMYFVTVHPELFYPVTQRGMKFLCCVLIVFSRQLLFASGLWGSLVTIALTDFLAGMSMVLRQGIFMVLGISMENYSPGSFRWLPFITLLLAGIFVCATLMRWLEKYKSAFDEPGLLFRGVAVCYFLPTFFWIRPVEVLDLSYEALVILGGGTAVFMLLVGWLFLLGHRRQIGLENHYLVLQTELFAEHMRVLKEQLAFTDRCTKALEGTALCRKETSPGEDGIQEKPQVYSEHVLFNLILQKKCALCRNHGVQIQFQKERLLFPEIEAEIPLLTVFYNLFDNALEAARACENGEIFLASDVKEETFHLQIENSKRAQQPIRLFGTSKPDKENHGLGLKIVHELLEQHGGRVVWREEKERVIAEIFWPLGELE